MEKITLLVVGYGFVWNPTSDAKAIVDKIDAHHHLNLLKLIAMPIYPSYRSRCVGFDIIPNSSCFICFQAKLSLLARCDLVERVHRNRRQSCVRRSSGARAAHLAGHRYR